MTIEPADLQLAIGYLRNLERQFADIPPKGSNPMFFHTLSHDGDVAEGERLRGLIARLSDGISSAIPEERK